MLSIFQNGYIVMYIGQKSKNMISQLLNKNPLLRPTPNRILVHPLFTGSSTLRMVGEGPSIDVFLPTSLV